MRFGLDWGREWHTVFPEREIGLARTAGLSATTENQFRGFCQDGELDAIISSRFVDNRLGSVRHRWSLRVNAILCRKGLLSTEIPQLVRLLVTVREDEI